MDRFEALAQFHRPAFSRGVWEPAADVLRTREGWLVRMELAGVPRNDIEITLRGRRLRICGRRRDWAVEEIRQCVSLEIAYTKFCREFEFPVELDLSRTSIDYRDGMLLVRIAAEEASR